MLKHTLIQQGNKIQNKSVTEKNYFHDGSQIRMGRKSQSTDKNSKLKQITPKELKTNEILWLGLFVLRGEGRRRTKQPSSSREELFLF